MRKRGYFGGLALALVAVALLGIAGCKEEKKDDTPKKEDQPTKTEHPKGEHPKGEHPKK